MKKISETISIITIAGLILFLLKAAIQDFTDSKKLAIEISLLFAILIMYIVIYIVINIYKKEPIIITYEEYLLNEKRNFSKIYNFKNKKEFSLYIQQYDYAENKNILHMVNESIQIFNVGLFTESEKVNKIRPTGQIDFVIIG